MEYGFSKSVSLSYEAAIDRVTAELAAEGFGVLTTIDVGEILRKKLKVEFGKYTILGACNPPLAHKALLTDRQIGLLLPCNVIVYEKNGTTVVGAFDPMVMLSLSPTDALRPVAEEVHAKLQRVLERV